MDPNQPITTVRHGVLNVLKKTKCFLRGLLECLREEKNVNAITTGSEIAPSWAPMRLKIQSWRPEFHSWSPASDL